MSTSDPHLAGTSSPRSKGKRLTVKRAAAFVVILPAATVILIAAIHFPYDVDAPLTEADAEKNRRFYAEAYEKAVTANEQGVSDDESAYTRVAEAAANASHIED